MGGDFNLYDPFALHRGNSQAENRLKFYLFMDL
jgi:hypothetical protein